MNRKEMEKAIRLAEHPDFQIPPLEWEFWASVFDGIRRHQTFQSTMPQLVAILNWQARYLCGDWDQMELQNLADLFRKNLMILDTIEEPRDPLTEERERKLRDFHEGKVEMDSRPIRQARLDSKICINPSIEDF